MAVLEAHALTGKHIDNWRSWPLVSIAPQMIRSAGVYVNVYNTHWFLFSVTELRHETNTGIYVVFVGFVPSDVPDK